MERKKNKKVLDAVIERINYGKYCCYLTENFKLHMEGQQQLLNDEM
jgi:hypothetical protein